MSRVAVSVNLFQMFEGLHGDWLGALHRLQNGTRCIACSIPIFHRVRNSGHPRMQFSVVQQGGHRFAQVLSSPCVAPHVDAGAGLLCGGEVLSESCYAPTVLLDPPPEAKVSQLEIFGPVVCVYSYDDLDEAIARANALDVAFQAAVFTRSLDIALQCYRQLDASAVMVNDHTAFRVDWMPFAGLRQSGLGVGGIPYTFHDMQIEKMLVVKSDAL